MAPRAGRGNTTGGSGGLTAAGPGAEFAWWWQMMRERKSVNPEAPKTRKQERRPERGWVNPRTGRSTGSGTTPTSVNQDAAGDGGLLAWGRRQEGGALSHLRGGLGQWKRPEDDRQEGIADSDATTESDDFNVLCPRKMHSEP
ncbi:UNVERIFIED_CONTAM: hypothetical protein K2H54_022675 [Gekko kuhli]